ncbi:MAG: hydrogenase small subunit [Planctomycetes bacterium]|nr:hydrogenase small subunit [Planctomycetota bacterium]
MARPANDTIGERLRRCGVDRREFLGFVGRLAVAAPAALALTRHLALDAIAGEIEKARRPSVVWLHFQDCTGCSETLLRTSKPDLAELILHLVSLDYHETVMAASGKQAEAALHDAMTNEAGRFVLVVEGSIPTKERGHYMRLAGRPALEVLQDVAAKAAAVIAIGSCASWGGLPSAPPNPTGAVGVDSIVKDKPIVNIPGCPPNPYTFLGVVLQFATAGTLPALDRERRPLFAYDRTIHEHCPRRAHFDAGRFARQFGDDGHRHGWCLYQLGCKGPVTHAGCSTRHFNEVPDAWPIGIGAPCVGCTERDVAFKVPMFDRAPVVRPTPPDTYPPVVAPTGTVDPLATGLVGLAVGAVVGGTYVASKRFSKVAGDESVPGRKDDPPPRDGDGGPPLGGKGV